MSFKIDYTTSDIDLIKDVITIVGGGGGGSGGGDVTATGTNFFTGTNTFNGSTVLNSLSASSILETGVGKNIIAVAKSTGYNLPLETLSTNIKSNGIQSVGTLSTVARADHVHPSDTTTVHLAGNEIITGNKTLSGTTTLTGITSKILSTDASSNIIGTIPSTAYNKNYETLSTNIKSNGIQSVGTLDTVARADHVHPSDINTVSVTTTILPVLNSGLTGGGDLSTNRTLGTENYIKSSINTGSIQGLTFSSTVGTALYSITAGTGVIVDSETDPINPTIVSTVYTGVVNASIINVASPSVWFMINQLGTVVESTTLPTALEMRHNILVGYVSMYSNLVFDSVPFKDSQLNKSNQMREFLHNMGIINSSVSISPVSTLLKISTTGGKLVYPDVGSISSDSNAIILPTQSPLSFYIATQTTVNPISTTVFPIADFYDFVGTVTSNAGASTTAINQRVYMTLSGKVIIEMGQTIYPTLTDALTAVPTESLVLNSYLTKDKSILIAVVSVTKGAVNLENSLTSAFTFASPFGQVSAGGSVAGSGGGGGGTVYTANNGISVLGSVISGIDATTSVKGVTQLSDTLGGTTSTVAVTDTALTNGLLTKQGTLSVTAPISLLGNTISVGLADIANNGVTKLTVATGDITSTDRAATPKYVSDLIAAQGGITTNLPLTNIGNVISINTATDLAVGVIRTTSNSTDTTSTTISATPQYVTGRLFQPTVDRAFTSNNVPTSNNELVSKEYADGLASGTTILAAATVSTISNIALNQTTTIVDGITVTNGMRILVKDQTLQKDNGVYLGSTTTTWTRSTDADTTSKLFKSSIVVLSGTNSGSTFFCNIPNTVILGTDPVTFIIQSATSTNAIGVLEYNNSTVYPPNRKVSYLGSIWQALSSVTGVIPTSSATEWVQITGFSLTKSKDVSYQGFDNKGETLPYLTIQGALNDPSVPDIINIIDSDYVETITPTKSFQTISAVNGTQSIGNTITGTTVLGEALSLPNAIGGTSIQNIELSNIVAASPAVNIASGNLGTNTFNNVKFSGNQSVRFNGTWTNKTSFYFCSGTGEMIIQGTPTNGVVAIVNWIGALNIRILCNCLVFIEKSERVNVLEHTAGSLNISNCIYIEGLISTAPALPSNSINVGFCSSYNRSTNLYNTPLITGGCFSRFIYFNYNTETTGTVSVPTMKFASGQTNWAKGGMYIYNNKVWKWGATSSTQFTAFQLGNSLSTQYPIEQIFRTTVPITGFLDIAYTSDSAIALTNDGRVFEWGWNANNGGYLADQVIFPNSELITKIYCPNNSNNNSIYVTSFFAISTTGKVLSWGDNSQGQLGIGNSITQTTPQVVTTLNGINIVKISVSGNDRMHVIALSDVGGIYTWGYRGSQANSSALGLGTTASSNIPVAVTGFGTGVADIIALCCFDGTNARNFTRILKTDGTSWATGSNAQGQLAIGTTTGSLVFVQETTLKTNIVAMGGGETTTGGASYIIDSTGVLYFSGNNPNSCFGDGSTADSNHLTFTNTTQLNNAGFQGKMTNGLVKPKVVFNNAVSIVSSYNSCVILDNTGTVWGVGYNSSANLGLGYTTSPVTSWQKVPFSLGSYATDILGINGYATVISLSNGRVVSAGEAIQGGMPIDSQIFINQPLS